MKNVARVLASGILAIGLAGCPAVFPEIGTQMHHPPQGMPLEPPPPPELRWLKFTGAKIPEKTRDGRSWGQSFGGKLPDPYAKLFVNDKEVMKTPIQGQTLEPTWPDGPKGNYVIKADDKLRVELWDSHAINDQPIGVKDVGKINDDMLMNHAIRIELEGGGELTLALEPAHAMTGLGLWVELRNDSCFVTRMIAGSPAERAGLKALDEVTSINKKPVKKMTPDEVRSVFNAVPPDGLALGIKHEDGSTLAVTLKEGPIYPVSEQFGPVD